MPNSAFVGPAEDVPDLLRLSKSQARQLELLRTDAVMGMGAGELGYRFGAETGLDVLLLRAALMGLEVDQISVKATTSERLGFTGRGEGIACIATCALVAT